MQDSIPVKRRTWSIYLIIILSFLLLAWIVWVVFESRIKEVGSKKKEQAAVETIKKKSTCNSTNYYNILPVLTISNQHVS